MSKNGFYLVELLVSTLLLSFFAVLIVRYYCCTVDWYVETKEVMCACDALQKHIESSSDDSQLEAIPIIRTPIDTHGIFVGESNRSLISASLNGIALVSLALTWSTKRGATRIHEVIVARRQP